MSNEPESDTPLVLNEADCRSEVIAFAHDMECRLRANDYKGDWGEETLSWLRDQAQIEMEELSVALCEETIDRIIEEAADVANFCMMIADIARRMK